MTDKEEIIDMLHKIGYKETPDSVYMGHSVYHEAATDFENDGYTSPTIVIQGGGYGGFHTELVFDSEGSLIKWNCWE